MKKGQKVALIIGIIVIVLMGIYPPWYLYYSKSERIKDQNLNYAFFTTPPPKPKYWSGLTEELKEVPGYVDIDYTRLGIQCSVVLIATGGFLVILKDKKN